MGNKVRHYVLNSCITNRYHLTDTKIEKSPFPIKFVHCPSNKIDISFLKMPRVGFDSVVRLVSRFSSVSSTPILYFDFSLSCLVCFFL